VLCVASSGNFIVSGGEDRCLVVTALSPPSTASLECRISPCSGSVLCVDINPADRRLILSGTMAGECRVDRVERPSEQQQQQLQAQPAAWTVIASFRDHSKYVVRARWSPDGDCFVTASYDRSVCVYAKVAEGDGAPTWRQQHRWCLPGVIEALEFAVRAVRSAFACAYFSGLLRALSGASGPF